MRMYDVCCDCTQDADGTWTLAITTKGLDFDQASAIAERSKEPFRAILTDVVGDGGAIPTVHQDLMRKPQ